MPPKDLAIPPKMVLASMHTLRVGEGRRRKVSKRDAGLEVGQKAFMSLHRFSLTIVTSGRGPDRVFGQLCPLPDFLDFFPTILVAFLDPDPLAL